MNLFAIATLFCAFLLVPLINLPVLRSLIERWSMDGQPGYVVVALSLYFAWHLLQRSAALPARPSPLGALLLFGISFVSLAGFAAQVQVVQQVALWLQVGLWVAAVLGWRVARLLLPAWLMLLFALPIFDALTDPLRMLAVAVTRALLQVIEIPAFIDGYYIAVPAGRFFVAGGCSGLNFLIAGTMIGYLHAYLHFSQRWRQVMVILLAAACAVVGNWVRVGALVLIGYHTEMRSELVYHHGSFGWWVFAGVMGLFFLLSHYLALGDPRHGRAMERLPMARQSLRKLFGWGVGMLLVVALFPAWAGWQQRESVSASLSLPSGTNWREIELPSWRPQFEGFDRAHYWQIRGAAGAGAFDLQVLTWLEQHQGKEMIYWSNAIAAEQDRLGRVVIERDGLQLNRSLVRDRGAPRLVWWLYRIGPHTAVRDDIGKLLQLLALLQGESSTALVAVSLLCATPLCQLEMEDKALEQAAVELLQEYLRASSS